MTGMYLLARKVARDHYHNHMVKLTSRFADKKGYAEPSAQVADGGYALGERERKGGLYERSLDIDGHFGDSRRPFPVLPAEKRTGGGQP